MKTSVRSVCKHCGNEFRYTPPPRKTRPRLYCNKCSGYRENMTHHKIDPEEYKSKDEPNMKEVFAFDNPSVYI